MQFLLYAPCIVRQAGSQSKMYYAFGQSSLIRDDLVGNVCEGSCVDSFWDDNLQNRETGNLLQFAAIHCNSLQFIGQDSFTVRFTALTGGYDDN